MPARHQLLLQENQPQILTGGAELRALAGVVWITETGAAGDVFLAAGQSHRLEGRGRVVVEAVRGEARLELRRADGQAWEALLQRLLPRIASRTAAPGA